MEYYFEIHYSLNNLIHSEVMFKFAIVEENEQKAQRVAYALERQLRKDNPWFEEADFIKLFRCE